MSNCDLVQGHHVGCDTTLFGRWEQSCLLNSTLTYSKVDHVSS